MGPYSILGFALVGRSAGQGGYDSGRLNLPFVGHATFGKYPPLQDWSLLNESDARVAILGVPMDMGTQYRSGARFGPRSIREASTLYQFGHSEVYDFDTDETYSYGKIIDVGDADMVHTDTMESHKRTQFAVETIIASGKMPVMLGGDHSITAPHCAALAKLGKNITLVQIDAHLDFVDERHGVRYGHGNCMRRCLEMDHIVQLIQLGIRGVSSTAREGFEDARRMGSVIKSVRQVRSLGPEGVAALVPEDASVYFSIDIDGFDPSLSMGTGTPSHGGFTYYEVKDILRHVIYRAGGGLVGMDLVEVSPPYDPAGVTATLAARVVLDAIGFENKRSQKSCDASTGSCAPK